MTTQEGIRRDFSEAQAREIDLPLNPIKRARKVNEVARSLGLKTLGWAPFALFPRQELIILGRAADNAREVREAIELIDQGDNE